MLDAAYPTARSPAAPLRCGAFPVSNDSDEGVVITVS